MNREKTIIPPEDPTDGNWVIAVDGSLRRFQDHEAEMAVVPDGVVEIGRAFYGHRNLQDVRLPESVTTIDTEAFCDCENLRSVNIPAGVKKIGLMAFYNCKSLSRIVLPGNITEIGNSAFGSSGITEFVFPENMTVLSEGLFRWCKNLTRAVLPENISKIADFTFFECENLSEILIPENVTEIGRSAFEGCKQLKISIPPFVSEIKEFALQGVLQVTSESSDYPVDEAGCLFDAKNNKLIYAPPALSGCYSVPEGISEIEEGAFSGCKNLTGIIFPEGITKIGAATFENCESLTRAVLPEGITEIGSRAFEGCTKLTDITLPDSVTKIGDHAFAGCANLTDITLPDSVVELSRSAFPGAGCAKKLKKIYPDLYIR
jgi:hypothetical protein